MIAHIRKGEIHTSWRFVPSTSLGGDAFGYHWLNEDDFAMYLIDVSGHGVGAALLLCETGLKEPELTALRTPNYVIGGMPESTYEKRQFKIDKNSTLYIFSDGVYEVEKPDGSM